MLESMDYQLEGVLGQRYLGRRFILFLIIELRLRKNFVKLIHVMNMLDKEEVNLIFTVILSEKHAYIVVQIIVQLMSTRLNLDGQMTDLTFMEDTYPLML